MKKITPGALVALKEALAVIYHYKRDFETFIKQSVKDPAILARVNWNDVKRNTASLVVDSLAKDEARHQATLLDLMSDVARLDDFAHLEPLENGKEKAKKAKDAVAALRKLIKEPRIINLSNLVLCPAADYWMLCECTTQTHSNGFDRNSHPLIQLWMNGFADNGRHAKQSRWVGAASR